MIINVVDNGALTSFVQSNTLELLFAGNEPRMVVLTQEVFDEFRRNPNLSLDQRAAFSNWYDGGLASGQIITPDTSVNISHVNGLHPLESLRGTFGSLGDVPSGDLGEISIGRYVLEDLPTGSQVRVISHDSSLLNPFGSQKRVPVDFQSQSSVEFINLQVEKGSISTQDYKNFFDPENTNLFGLAGDRGGIPDGATEV